MSSKADKIKEMLEMQKKFMEIERESFTPEAGSALDGYRQKYRDLAMEVVDMAHADKGSER